MLLRIDGTCYVSDFGLWELGFGGMFDSVNLGLVVLWALCLFDCGSCVDAVKDALWSLILYCVLVCF